MLALGRVVDTEVPSWSSSRSRNRSSASTYGSDEVLKRKRKKVDRAMDASLLMLIRMRLLILKLTNLCEITMKERILKLWGMSL